MKRDKITVSYQSPNKEETEIFDLVSIARTAIKIRLLGEIERLEEKAKIASSHSS